MSDDTPIRNALKQVGWLCSNSMSAALERMDSGCPLPGRVPVYVVVDPSEDTPMTTPKRATQDPEYLREAHEVIRKALRNNYGTWRGSATITDAILDALASHGWHLINAEDYERLADTYAAAEPLRNARTSNIEDGNLVSNTPALFDAAAPSAEKENDMTATKGTLRAVIEAYLFSVGFTTFDYVGSDPAWNHPEFGYRRTFNDALRWQMEREQAAAEKEASDG